MQAIGVKLGAAALLSHMHAVGAEASAAASSETLCGLRAARAEAAAERDAALAALSEARARLSLHETRAAVGRSEAALTEAAMATAGREWRV